jgi:hypothetical protein
LLPLNGSDTNWYKNMLVNPMSKLSLNGTEILSVNGRPITDKNRVADVVRKFNSRYGEGEVKNIILNLTPPWKSPSDRQGQEI